MVRGFLLNGVALGEDRAFMERWAADAAVIAETSAAGAIGKALASIQENTELRTVAAAAIARRIAAEPEPNAAIVALLTQDGMAENGAKRATLAVQAVRLARCVCALVVPS
jgi:hypothetical protein